MTHKQKPTHRQPHGKHIGQSGFQHILIAGLMFVALFAIAGGYFMLSSRAATPTKSTPQITWIINTGAVSSLKSAGASNTLINTAFSNNHTYVSAKTAGQLGVPTAVYQSYQAIKNAFASGALPGHFKAVIYDNENWSLTPAAEQKDPAHYEYLTAQLLHQHGMKYIATPATDIVKALGAKGNIYTAFVQQRIAAQAARYADVYDIQAQGTETNLSQFKSFIASASAQAKQANPKVVVLVGLSTNPSGKTATSSQLYSAYTTARPYAAGYWLNIPGQGTQCSNCGVPQPQAALALLQKIY